MGLRLSCLALALAITAGCDQGKNASKATQATELPPVPSALADGTKPARLPPALRRFRGRPVLGARELAAGPAVRSCPVRDPSTRRKARFSEAWLTTEGLTVQYLVGPPPQLFACDAFILGEGWHVCGGAFSYSRNPRRIELAGGRLELCWRPGPRPRYHPFMWIAVPARVPWVLVDHYSYWVAYPPAGRRLLRISGIRGISRSSFRVKLAFVDAHGRVLRERVVMGGVAG